MPCRWCMRPKALSKAPIKEAQKKITKPHSMFQRREARHPHWTASRCIKAMIIKHKSKGWAEKSQPPTATGSAEVTSHCTLQAVYVWRALLGVSDVSGYSTPTILAPTLTRKTCKSQLKPCIIFATHCGHVDAVSEPRGAHGHRPEML